MYKGQSIAVIIPCLNEEQGVEKVLRAIPEFVDEIIVVDNASTDRTSEVAESLGAKVIREDVRGYGRSYKRGFASAASDLIVTLDGDQSYPVDALSYLLEAFRHLEVDFLNACRFPVRDHRAMSFKNKFGNLVLSMVFSALFFRWVRDSQSGMWVFRRSILKHMKLESDGMAFSEEIKIEAVRNRRIRFGEISIQYSSRLGESKLNAWREWLPQPGIPRKKAIPPMSVAAIVPVWNGREWLVRLLAALDRQTHPVAELIVVDNGSTDGAPEMAKERGARVIAMGRNAGFAAAVNRGIQECHTQWIAVLNSDVELAPDYLEKLTAADAWFATGKILALSDRSTLDGTFDAICRGGTAWRVGSGRSDSPAFSQRRAISSAPWTAALFRAEIFQRVGLLDERFESYLEDVDFGLRCAAQGIAGMYEPAAVAWHRGTAAALGRWHPETVRRIARNQIYLLARHYPARLLARWKLWPILVAHLLWGGVALRHGTSLAWLRGAAQGVAGFRSARKAGPRIDPGTLEKLLNAHERTIHQFQAATGYDTYWRWYFRLTGSGA